MVEGTWSVDRGVAILSFPSLRDAELWKDSVPEIRQHDWMDGVDFIIVPTTSLPCQYLVHYTGLLTVSACNSYCYYCSCVLMYNACITHG